MSRTHMMGRHTAAVVAALLALAVGGASTLAAQSANISATATVLQPINITAANDLKFGNVFPAVNKTVAFTDAANAGQFSVAGDGGAQLAITFTLPTDLNGPAGSTLPIDTWTGYHNTANSATVGGTPFTPSGSTENANLSGTTGNPGSLFVFIGATVKPAANQTPGSYTNTVMMTVAYTGS